MPTVRTIKLTELSKELGNFADKSLEQQKTAVVAGLYRSLPGLVKASPVDTGLYAQSWDVKHDNKGAQIGNFAPHGPIIEFGARPFVPPIGPLLAWAKRVLKDGSQPPNYSSNVWALAKYTQKKISQVGMAPKHILENAIPDILKNIELEMDKVK